MYFITQNRIKSYLFDLYEKKNLYVNIDEISDVTLAANDYRTLQAHKITDHYVSHIYVTCVQNNFIILKIHKHYDSQYVVSFTIIPGILNTYLFKQMFQ